MNDELMASNHVFLESFHEAVKLFFSMSQTGLHLLNHLLLGVSAEPAARLHHLDHVFLLHTPHKHATDVNRCNWAGKPAAGKPTGKGWRQWHGNE